MLAKKSHRAAPMFTVRKKHSWKSRVVPLLLRLFIFIVLVGTIIWFIVNSHLKLPTLPGNFARDLAPKIASSSAGVKETNIDKIKKLIAKESLFQVANVTQTDNYLVVVSKDNLEIYFSLDKDLSQQVTTLQTLITKAKIDNKTLKKVDFRFDKIVVQY